MEKISETTSFLNSPFWVAFIGGLLALIGGLIGAYVKPNFEWGIEKRRSRHENRLHLIADVRRELSSKGFSLINFRSSEIFSRLVPHLSKELNDEFSNITDEYIYLQSQLTLAPEAHKVKMNLFQELFELEKKWELI